MLHAALCAREVERLLIVNAAPSSLASAITGRRGLFIFANQVEAEVLAGRTCATPEAAATVAAELVSGGAAAAVITLGPSGAVAVDDQGSRVHGDGFEVDAVDTVGAGDAFCAALAVRLAEGAGLAHAVRFANAAGAVACTRPGAEPSMPRRADVEALLGRA